MKIKKLFNSIFRKLRLPTKSQVKKFLLIFGIAIVVVLLGLTIRWYWVSNLPAENSVESLSKTYEKGESVSVGLGDKESDKNLVVRLDIEEYSNLESSNIESQDSNIAQKTLSNVKDFVNPEAEESRPSIGFEFSGTSKINADGDVESINECSESSCNTELEKKDNVYLAENVVENIDLAYEVIEDKGIKESIIINEFGDTIPNIYEFDLLIDEELVEVHKGLTQSANNPTGSYYFTDKSGEYLAHIEPPFAVDADDQKTYDVEILVENDSLKIQVDEDWLYSDDREFPVIIDPTIVHDTQSEFASGNLDRLQDTGSGASDPIVEMYEQLVSVNNPYLVGLWRMENNWNDSSGNGNNGTASGNAGFTTSSKMGGYAGTFDGTGDYVTITTDPTLDPESGAFSIAGWFKTSDTDTYNGLLGKWSGSGGVDAYFIATNSGGDTDEHLTFGLYDAANSYFHSNAVVADGVWHHFVVTYDSFSGYKHIYIDGELDNSLYWGTDKSVDISSNLTLGRGYVGGWDYNGQLDEIAIFRKALNNEEVEALYLNRSSAEYVSPVIDLTRVNSWTDLAWTEKGVATGDGETPYSTTGLVAQWNFNETSGTTANNDAEGSSCGGTPSNCDGTLTNFASTSSQDVAVGTGWTSDNRRWGAGALMFDGSDDYVQVNDNNALDFGTGDFTVTAWVKHLPDSLGLITSKVNSTNNSGWAFRTVNGYLQMVLDDNSSYKVEGSIYVGDNKWHYVVAQRSGDYLKLFVDGIEDSSSSGVNSVDVSGTENLNIGRREVTVTGYFKSILDSVSIYNRALSADEILSNYNATNIQFQTRSGDTSTPDATWDDWKPNSNETSIIDFEQGPGGFYSNNSRGAVDFDGGYSSSYTGATPPSTPTGCSNNQTLIAHNPSESTQTNFQIPVTIDYATGMSSDFSDLRFTNAVGTDLDYWIEDYTASTDADIWIEVDSMKPLSYNTIFMFYNGCTGGNSSDADNTLELYDDFNDNSIDTSKWQVSRPYSNDGDEIDESSGYLRCKERGYLYTQDEFTDVRVKYKAKVDNTEQKIQTFARSDAVATGSYKEVSNAIGIQGEPYTSAVESRKRVSGDATTFSSSSFTSGTDWHDYAFTIYGESGDIRLERFWDSSSYVDKDLTFESSTNEYVHFYCREAAVGYAYYDDVIITKYVYPEPEIIIPNFDEGPFVDGNASVLINQSTIPIDEYTVGLWDFNETNGDLAGYDIFDLTDNNYDLEIRSGTSVVDGIEGKARYFDGNDYIEMPDAVIPPGNEITVSYWTYGDSLYSTNTKLLVANENTNRSINIHHPWSNNFVYWDAGNSGTTYDRISKSVSENDLDGSWNHWVFTKNANTEDQSMKIYLNGELIQVATGKTYPILASDEVYLGGYGTYWTGTIDLFRIDNIERSAEEIAEMYRLGSNKRYVQDISSTDLSSKLSLPFYVAGDIVGSPIEISIGESDYSIYEPDSNTVAFWHLDEPIYPDLENDLVKFTSTNITSTNAYTYWKTLDATATVVTGDTIEYDVFLANDLASVGGIEVVSTTQAFRDLSGWQDQNSISCHPNYDISDYAYNNWYHRKCTVPSGANGNVLDYINLVNEYNTNAAITAYYANVEVYSSAGVLKEVVYDGGDPDYNEYYIRSNSSNTADSSLSNASFSNITPLAKIEDSSAEKNHGISYGPETIEGKIGRAMDFNGTSDYVKASEMLPSMSAFTMEAWFKTTVTSGWGYIVGQSTSYEGSAICLNGDNNTGLRFFSDLAGEKRVDSTSNVRDGKWHHVAGVYNGSALKIYVDGIYEARWSSISESQPAFIPYIGVNNAQSNYFEGSIDEVRISDVARTADQIRQAYEYGRRSHVVTIDFVSSLSSVDLTGTSEFNALSDTSIVLANDGMIDNIFESETIIIRENYAGTEYYVQAEVTDVNTGTRTITVDDFAGNVPEMGTGVCGGSYTHCFTSNATVFKWQREYWDITSPLDEDINGIQRFSIRLLDGSVGRNIWLDGLDSAGAYLTDPSGSTITSLTDQYFQYRAIYTTNDSNVSASLEDVTLDYDDNFNPVNTSLTLTNPYGGDGNDVVTDESTDWTFRAVVNDEDGYTDFDTVVLRLADATDNSAPFEDLEFTWTQSSDSFSETIGSDANDAVTITSDSSDTSCTGNQCTIDFNLQFNSSFTTELTDYDGALLTTDDNATTDSDTYTDIYQVIVDSPAVNESLTFTNPYGGSGNTVFANGSTEYIFSAVVSDPDGYTNLTSVELALADSTDSSVPYEDLQFLWSEDTDDFSEPVDDSNSAVSITSTSEDSTCSGNQCTLNFKLIFNSNFETELTNYSAQLITTGFGTNTDTDTYSDIYQVDSGYVVSDINEDFDVTKIEDWSTDLTSVPQLGELEVGIKDSNNIKIAKFDVDFDEDLDWSELTIDVDSSENKSIFHYEGGITAVPGVSSSDYELYVPKGSGDKVGICPNATTLSDVNNNCSGLVIKTIFDSDVSVVTEDGVEYWLISGLTGTGAYSTTVTPVGDNQIQNFMHAQVINGETYIAIATEGGVSITNESDGASVNSSYTSEVYQAIISKDGHLYYSTEAGDVKVAYNIENLSNNFDSDFNYSSSSTPAILYSSGEIKDLAISDGVSFVDGKSNVIYVATDNGVSVINEHQQSETNGSVKYFNTDRVSEDMLGDVRGMWGFDDNSSNTTLVDISVNSNDLTLSVNTDTIDVSGIRDLGLTLGSQSITRSDDSDFDFSSIEDFSISLWAKHGTISTSADYLLTKSQAGTNGGYQLYMDSDGDFVFAIDDDSTWTPDDSVGASLSNNYDDDNWHHLVAIKENTESIKLYLDNVLIDSDTDISATSTLENDDALYVGVDDTGSANYWDGEIDELMITAEVLDQSQIEKLYLAGKRSMQNHTANKVPGIGSDEYQQLTGSVDFASSLAVDSGNQLVFVGTNDTTSDTGSLSVFGRGSDSLIDYFNSENSLKISDLGTGIASTDNDIISLSVSGNPFLDESHSLLAFAYSDSDNDSTASKLWMQSSDISLNGVLENLYSDTLTVENLQTSQINLTNQSGGANSGTIVGSILATSTGDIQINSTSDSSVNIGDESTRNNLNVSGDIELKGSIKMRELDNIADVYIYDTTNDIDAGAWRFGSEAKASSWYNEDLDDVYDGVCNGFVTGTTGDDRCGSKEFPMIAYLIVTDDALYIYDAERNIPWMRFDQGGTDESDRNLIGLVSATITSVRAMDGNIYVTGTDNCYSISFVQDKSYTTWNRLVWYNGNISERNSGVGESS